MGTWVTASQSDTFCGLAVRNGFKDCQKLRDDSNNAAIKDRQLQAGDKVFIPDLKEKEDSKPTESQHVYVKLGSPIASIRFVRGGKDNEITTERTINHLQISNYRTDQAGADGTKDFVDESRPAFNEDAFADPDAFKIEVSDRRATGTTIDAKLQALHPVYKGKIVVGHDLKWSSAAEKDKRKLDTKLHRAKALPDQRYRSPYLRLVVDEKDKEARSKQTILVTDDQPNEEKVEILDQKIRATYIIKTCPIAGDAQCRARAEAKIGGRDRSKKRIKLTVGILRQTAGNAKVGFNGVTEDNIKHRVFRWLRRVYAQADVAPLLVDPFIRFLDPPDRNLVTVSDVNGLAASGISIAGTSPSNMSFRVTATRNDGTTVTKDVSLDIPRAATPAARLTPIQIANQLAGKINDANFTAQPFQNATSLRSLSNDRSADILIRDRQGGKVAISAVAFTDNIATLTLANVNLNAYQYSGGNDSANGSRHERQLLRNYDTGTDRMDCYVIGQFNSNSIRGRSYLPGLDAPANYRPPKEIKNSCVMGANSTSGLVMDGSDNLPYTFPHELGHAILDCFHTTSEGSELMSGGGTSQTAAVDGTKRLCDVPVKIAYNAYNPTANYETTASVGRSVDFFASSRLTTISPEVYQDW